MIKIISSILLTILILYSFSGCASTVDDDYDLSESTEPEEYTDDEFPQWADDLRRAEIIFFGSIPFTILASNAGFSVVSLIASGSNASITDFTSTASMTNDDRIIILATGAGLSAVIAIADAVIGWIENSDAEDE